jgi:hypothetical protein
MLDALTKKLMPLETVVTKKKRKKAASEATPVRGSAFVFGHTREQASLPTVPQSVAASGTSAASLGDEIEPNSRIGGTSSVLTEPRAMPFPAANINRMSQLDANSSGVSLVCCRLDLRTGPPLMWRFDANSCWPMLRK